MDHVRVTEMVAYRAPDGCAAADEPKRAPLEADGLFPGFALRGNDSWECRFQRDVHCPAADAAAPAKAAESHDGFDAVLANLQPVRSSPGR